MSLKINFRGQAKRLKGWVRYRRIVFLSVKYLLGEFRKYSDGRTSSTRPIRHSPSQAQAPAQTAEKADRFHVPMPHYIAIALAAAGLGIIIYGVYSLSPASELLPMWIPISVGVLATISAIFAYLAYKTRPSSPQKKVAAQTTVTPPPPATPTPIQAPQLRSSGLRWAAIAVIVIVVAGTLYTVGKWAYSKPPATSAKSDDSGQLTILVGKEWSEPIRVPLGEQVVWKRDANVAYEVVAQDGKVYAFPRDIEGDARTPCEKHIWIPGRLSSFKVRVTDSEAEALGLELRFSPYGNRPCQGVKPVPPPLFPQPLPIPPQTVPVTQDATTARSGRLFHISAYRRTN